MTPALSFAFFLSLLLHRPHRAFSAPASDLVTSLPDYGVPPAPQYSGHLDGTPGCDTSSNGDACLLHYWFASADGPDAADRPVILWLNGGPGSSSLLGFLQENGPLLLNSTGGLMTNPWSWTKVANLLALESPVGVGYSYCAAQRDGGGGVCENTDKFTASTARAALVDFFANKFPELANNKFYIVGESYAGVYIPTLAEELLDNAADTVNLRGVAAGDPCTDNDSQRDAMDVLWYGHKYGYVPDAEYDLLWNECGARYPNLMARAGGPRLAASELRERVEEELGVKWSELDANDREVRSTIADAFRDRFLHPGENFAFDAPECKVAHRKFLLQTSKGFTQGWAEHAYINDYDLYGPGGLTKEDDDMAAYLTRPDVRRALHVEDVPTDRWPHPEGGFRYRKEYDACNPNAEDGALSMIDFYRSVAPRLDVTLVFNGDSDPCVSYEGTRTAVERVGYKTLPGGSYRPWFYNHTAADVEVLLEKPPKFGPDLQVAPTGTQMGGSVVDYEHGLSFLTVHGSGHMVPQFRPQAALHMVRKVLGDAMFSPPLPEDGILESMSEREFQKAMDEWTDAARSPPYVGVEEEEGATLMQRAEQLMA